MAHVFLAEDVVFSEKNTNHWRKEGADEIKEILVG